MAIKVLERGSGEGCNCVTTYLCDTEDDVATLSTETSVGACGSLCSAGSMALVAETHNVYILNTQGEWK